MILKRKYFKYLEILKVLRRLLTLFLKRFFNKNFFFAFLKSFIFFRIKTYLKTKKVIGYYNFFLSFFVDKILKRRI